MADDGVAVVERLAERTSAHDLEGMVALIHPDYRSEQPLHPARNFVGRAQMRANWAALLAAVPDMHAELVRATQQGETVWSEWRWWGTLESGDAFELRGIALFDVHEGLVVSGRLFTELVEHEGMGIADSVEAQSGRRPELDPD
jgi:ketosteroid isomerase-like protein